MGFLGPRPSIQQPNNAEVEVVHLGQLQWLADEVWRETLREIADHLLKGARSFLRCAEEQLQTPQAVHIPGQQNIHFVLAKNEDLLAAIHKAQRIVQWLESYPLHESLTD